MITLPKDMRIADHENVNGPLPYLQGGPTATSDALSDLSFDDENDSDSEELEFEDEIKATIKRVIEGESEKEETQ